MSQGHLQIRMVECGHTQDGLNLMFAVHPNLHIGTFGLQDPMGKKISLYRKAAPGGPGSGWIIDPLYDDLGNQWPLNTIPWGELIAKFEEIVSQQPPE